MSSSSRAFSSRHVLCWVSEGAGHGLEGTSGLPLAMAARPTFWAIIVRAFWLCLWRNFTEARLQVSRHDHLFVCELRVAIIRLLCARMTALCPTCRRPNIPLDGGQLRGAAHPGRSGLRSFQVVQLFVPTSDRSAEADGTCSMPGTAHALASYRFSAKNTKALSLNS